jgi:hypothetical protein
MHGAGVLLAWFWWFGWRLSSNADRLCRGLVEKRFRILAEAVDAVRATKVVSFSLVLVGSGGVLRIDGHSTDRIDLRNSRRHDLQDFFRIIMIILLNLVDPV